MIIGRTGEKRDNNLYVAMGNQAQISGWLMWYPETGRKMTQQKCTAISWISGMPLTVCGSGTARILWALLLLKVQNW